MTTLSQLKFIRLIVLVLVLATSLPAMAGRVTTSQLLEQVQTNLHRDAVLSALARADVQRVLASKGVDQADARARVATMTDSEIALIHQQIDELPAGAGAGEAVLTVFLVLVILDALGVTDIFTFVRPVR